MSVSHRTALIAHSLITLNKFTTGNKLPVLSSSLFFSKMLALGTLSADTQVRTTS